MLGLKPAAKAEAPPEVSGSAIQGARSEQQDSFRLRWIENEKAWLLVLADGMGGHAGGGIASKIAVDGFVAAFVTQRGRGLPIEDAFRAALDDANLRIAQAQKNRADLADMGTTIVAAYLSEDGVCWISVGDSPMWVLRGGRLHRLNEDHSMREVAGSATHLRNMLQSVLNGQPIPMVDCHASPVGLRAEDVLVLSSDGLLTLQDDEIAEVAEAYVNDGADVVVEALLHRVDSYQKSNQDNCSVIVAFPPLHQAPAESPIQKLQREIVPTLISAFAGFAATLTIYFLISRVFWN